MHFLPKFFSLRIVFTFLLRYNINCQDKKTISPKEKEHSMTSYIFNLISLFGGLALFLFGMDTMGKALERQAGGKLQTILAKMSGKVWKGFLLGAAATAVIQSSSATTVMVVGFVNSGIMTLNQAVGVIMGSNVGTTITAWILSLSGLVFRLFGVSSRSDQSRFSTRF